MPDVSADLLGGSTDRPRDALIPARRRGVRSPRRRRGGPVSRHFGAVLMAFTLCRHRPAAIFRKRASARRRRRLAYRVLPRGTPWPTHGFCAARDSARLPRRPLLHRGRTRTARRLGIRHARRCTLHRTAGLARYDIEAAQTVSAGWPLTSAADQAHGFDDHPPSRNQPPRRRSLGRVRDRSLVSDCG